MLKRNEAKTKQSKEELEPFCEFENKESDNDKKENEESIEKEEEKEVIIRWNQGEKQDEDYGRKSLECTFYKRYKEALQFVLDKIDNFYEKLARSVVLHPFAWTLLCLVFVALCCFGFLRFDTEDRTEKLYVPQNSKSEKILTKTSPYFDNMLDVRIEEFILQAKLGDNVLIPECVNEAKELFKDVISISGFHALCVPKPKYIHRYQQYDYSHNCSLFNPLELIFNSSRALDDITEAFRNDEILMSAGQLPRYNELQMMAHVEKYQSKFTKVGFIRFVFHMMQTDKRRDVLEWEKKYIELLKRRQHQLRCSSLVFSAQRSVDDSITESSSADVSLVSIAFFLMITFACVSLGKIRNPIKGHSLLGCFGIICTGFGIAGGIGLTLLMGIPYVSIVGVLPFLLLSIGVDDMFIIIDEYDKQENEKTPVQRISKALKKVGATITMTTLTDIVAFAVSVTTAFPAIQYFCKFAAISLAVEFLLQVTMFLIFLSFDAKRIHSKRRDCLPCWKGEDKEFCISNVSENFATFFMRKYAAILVKWPTKIAVLFLTGCFFAMGVYGCLNVSQEFSRTSLVKDGSYFLDYVHTFENEFKASVDVSLVKLGTANYSDKKVQNEFEEAASATMSTNYYMPIRFSWIDFYRKWAASDPRINIEGRNFTQMLPLFLAQPSFTHFQLDIVTNKNGDIEASRTHVFMKPIWKSTFLRDAMLDTRKEFKKRNLQLIPISDFFIYFETFSAVVSEVTRNVCLTAAAVAIMTLPFCISPVIVLLILFSFALLITEIVGVMYLWNISMNGISMITLVMSVGFTVDYSAHVAYAFATSEERTVNARVVDSLSTVGASVAMGGISTFVGMLITFLSTSEVFRIFFRMLFGIVSFGLFNGLVLLPVLLSIFGFLV